jgi:O-acetyl-ADP-ribose deacetylase (regulator of RNase III)
VSDGVWVINFPTKDHWRNPSKLEYIEKGLADLKQCVRSIGLTSVAIPALGCGLGELDWPSVKARIHLLDAAIPEVLIKLYEPR